ncbi:LuxR family transcriptional regulator [Aliiroseovarius sp. PrR006]|uniref:helix-turn-helix transcriptional regulator n=1 Tax=Aliiroseovarius sp. PrR006 TaxID=2706883 RepID=UPI0013CFA090|nr:LuxR family transcriptional regulator [Aliiroseovarius sp. PrR006]NDW54057.1 LuxR family transcriptional regulator [Aliiroseovarius sp. PrR006]
MQPKTDLSESLSRLDKLAPSGYGIGLHIRNGTPYMMLRTYAPEWSVKYVDEGYVMVDPLVFWGVQNEGAIRWSEMDFPDPHHVLDQAATYGAKFGVAISIGPLTSRSIGGFSRSDREYTDAEVQHLLNVATELHYNTQPPESLTPAQRAALQLVAKGFRHAEAAAQLGISESALKARLRSVRERLSARTTSEALQRAQENRLI